MGGFRLVFWLNFYSTSCDMLYIEYIAYRYFMIFLHPKILKALCPPRRFHFASHLQRMAVVVEALHRDRSSIDILSVTCDRWRQKAQPTWKAPDWSRSS
jgi:hypothetical protein